MQGFISETSGLHSLFFVCSLSSSDFLRYRIVKSESAVASTYRIV